MAVPGPRYQAFNRKVREELICAICLDFLNEPKLLLCAHSFCQECLDGIVTMQTNYAMQASLVLNEGDLVCPSCRHVTSLPDGRVEGLKTNYNLKRLVDIVSEEEKQTSREVIKRGRSIRPSIRNTQPRCKTHLKPLEYFCLECNEMLCRKCMMGGHKDHNYQDVDEILPDQVAALRNLIQPAFEVASQAETMAQQLHKDKDAVSKNCTATTDAVRIFFEKMRKVLNQREKALISTIHKYSDIKLTKLDAQHQKLQEHRAAILQVVDKIKKMIQNGENMNVMLQKQALSEDLDVHQQAVLSISDLLKDSQAFSSFLSFKEDNVLCQQTSEVGTLNECQRKDTAFLSVRRLLVSEEEDPYLDVPLRFEDEGTSAPQKTMRFDETSQPPEQFIDKTYDVPKPPIPFHPKTGNVPKPLPSRSKTDDVLKPPVPSRSKTDVVPKPPVPSRSKTYDVPKPPVPSCSKTDDVPKPPVPSRSKTDDIPKHPVPSRSKTDDVLTPPIPPRPQTYDVPKLHTPTHPQENRPRSASPFSTHFMSLGYETYDVPRKSPENMTTSKSATLPNFRSTTRSFSFPEEPSEIEVESDEDYEPLLDIPIPKPRVKPPALPPNHPNQSKNKPVPRPRKQLVTSTSTSSVGKRRSQTLPATIQSPLGHPPIMPTVVQPILVIGNEQLSWPFSHETVYPCGICCTTIHDTLVVSDVFNHCLRLIDSKGKFIEKIGREGRAGGQFKEPSAVAITEDNHILVAERDNPRIQMFTATGKYLTKFGQKTLWGSQLSDPFGIAIMNNGSIFVTDWDKNRIYVYQSNGKYITVLGKDDGFFKCPAGIAINQQGELLVTDRYNHCIWVLTPSGDVVNKIGSKGSLPGQLFYPYGITVTENGSIVVTESGNHRLSVFSAKGDFVRCFGQAGTAEGMFDHPRHVCVNSKGHIIVADEMNQRLQVFELL